jgi:hypothetical protein
LNDLMADLGTTAALQTAVTRVEQELAGTSPHGEVLAARVGQLPAPGQNRMLRAQLATLERELRQAQLRVAEIPGLGAAAARASAIAHIAGT